MTNEELRQLIHSDPVALERAGIGDDAGCASRCVEIADPVRVETILTERGLYQRLGPVVAESVLQKFEAYQGAYLAQVRRVIHWMRPSEGGFDFGDDSFVALLALLIQDGIGITEPERQALLGLSLQPAYISAGQVSDAWSLYRPDGKVES